MQVRQEKWDLDVLFAERREVLAQWRAGQEVDLDEALVFHRDLPPEQNAAHAVARARTEGRVLIHPRAGVAALDELVEVLRHLQDEGGADLLPTTVDAYTRTGRFKAAEEAIRDTVPGSRSVLNGFPALAYGLEGCRKVVQAVARPLIVRTASPDFRLGAEVMLAAGYTGHSHGAMADLAYTKKTPIEEIIRNWQYVDRLCAYYEEHGCPISRDHHIPISSVVPPGLQIAATVIDGLLQLGQGANHCVLGYGQNGCIYQDIAGGLVMRKMGEEFAARLGYVDANITTALHQWLGSFPPDEAKAYSIICVGAAVAAWSGVSMTMVKTPHEAFGVPTKEVNAEACIATKMMLDFASRSSYPRSEQMETEIEMLCMEVRAMLDRVLDLGDGDLARGVTAAFKSGIIDIPFSPNEHNHGRVMPVRDDSGAFRYLDAGNIPLPTEVREYHRAQVSRRATAEGREPSYAMLVTDIVALSKGLYLGVGSHPA